MVDSPELIARWMRIPEAWEARQAVQPELAAEMATPLALAERIRETQTKSSPAPMLWDMARAATIDPPADFNAVLDLSKALCDADARGLHADVAGIVAARPQVWWSALAIAWPLISGQGALARALIGTGEPVAASILANALMAYSNTAESASALRAMLGDEADPALDLLARGGEPDLARALADLVPDTKPAGVAPLPAAVHAWSSGNLDAARQNLIAGWDAALDSCAAHGDRLADVALAQGDVVSAVEALKQALAQQPSRERQARLALLLAKSGRVQEAQAWLPEPPGSAQEYVACAAIALSANEPERAGDASRHAVQALRPDATLSPDWLDALAAALEATGQMPEAALVLAQWARWRPADSSLQARLAEALLAAGDAPAASRHAEAASLLQPASVPARRLFARALRAAGRPDEALAQWESVLEPDDNDHVETARCAIEAGRLDTATRVAERLTLSKAASATSLALLGRALLAAGRPSEARERLEAACAADPRDPDAWTTLAECHKTLGDAQAVGATLASAVQSAPGSAPIQHAYAVWLRGEGRASEALEAAAKAAADSNAAPEWTLEYGELLVELGHCAQAADVLRAVLAKRPGSWPIRRALAKALLGAGQPGEAASLVSMLPPQADTEARAFAGHVLVAHADATGDTGAARKALVLLEDASQGQISPEIEIGMARALEILGQPEAALDHYRVGLEQRHALLPETDRTASIGLARCATELNRAPLAIHALETAAIRHGASADLQIALSAAYTAGGQHRRALEAAQRASELSPDEASLRQLTHAAALAGENGLAQHAIQRLAALQPTSPHVWLTLAEVCAQSQDEAQSRSSLARALRLAHADASAWSRASDLLQRFGRPYSAQRAMRKALYASPQDADLVRKLAEASQETGDMATAQRAWMRFADLRADHSEDLKRAARALWLLNQRAVAIGHWQRVVALSPNDFDAHRDLARAYITEGDVPRALDHYRLITRAKIADLGLALEAAAAELHYGSLEQAAPLFKAATELAPQDLGAWVALGECLLLSGNAQEARKAFEAACRIDSTDVQALGGLAVAALDTGDATKAEAAYSSALRRTCDNAPAAAALARASLALGRWDNALASLDRLSTASPSLASLRASVETRLRLADAYWLHQMAGSRSHGPSRQAVSEQAGAKIQDLLTQLTAVATAWEVDRLRQRAALSFHQPSSRPPESAMRCDPSGEALEGLAIAWLRGENTSEALACLQNDRGRWHNLLLGMATLASGDLQAASDAFASARADAMLRPLAEHMLAEASRRHGDAQAYAEHASNALVEWSDEPIWHFELAQAYIQSGQPDAALPHLTQAADLAPEVTEYALTLARTAMDVDDVNAAYAGYVRVVRTMPIDGQAWKEAGLCALAAGDAVSAAEWLTHALNLLPGDVECLAAAARASLASGDIRQAHERVQAAYHVAPESAEVLLVKGEILAHQGKLDMALQSFDRALKRTDAPLPIHVARGRLLLQIGRGEQAIETLKAAVAQDPESAPGWAALSEMQESAGQLPEAVDAAARAVNFAPDRVAHRLQLGRLCRKTGQLDRALDELLRAQVAAKADGRVALELGRIYEERREFKRSLDAYQRAIEVDMSNGEAHFRAGLVLKQIKAYPQAGKMLKRAVELNPKDPEALHQLAAVRALELVHGGIPQQVVAP